MSSDLIPVRFNKAHGIYNSGEVAGFTSGKIDELRELGVVEAAVIKVVSSDTFMVGSLPPEIVAPPQSRRRGK